MQAKTAATTRVNDGITNGRDEDLPGGRPRSGRLTGLMPPRTSPAQAAVPSRGAKDGLAAATSRLQTAPSIQGTIWASTWPSAASIAATAASAVSLEARLSPRNTWLATTRPLESSRIWTENSTTPRRPR